MISKYAYLQLKSERESNPRCLHKSPYSVISYFRAMTLLNCFLVKIYTYIKAIYLLNIFTEIVRKKEIHFW